MNILIINQHTNNYGDDIAGFAFIENLLKNPRLEKINIIYNTPGILAIEDKRVSHRLDLSLKHIGPFNLISYFLLKSVGLPYKGNKALRSFTACVKTSDYIFVSPCGANIGIYQDWRFLLKLWIVTLEDKTPIFHLNTIGASGNKLFDKIAVSILSKSKLYVRERASRDYLKSLGLQSVLGVDSAFAGRKAKVKKNNEIGFVPTELGNWHPLFIDSDISESIFEKIVQPVVDIAKKHKLTIKLIPHLNSDTERIFYSRIETYIKSKGADARVVFPKSAYDYEKEIASCQIIVGMRYHSIVLAAKNSVPFVALAYENKMKEVCRYTNMENYAVQLYDRSFDQLDIEITKAIKRVLYNVTKLANILTDELPELREKAKLPLNELK